MFQCWCEHCFSASVNTAFRAFLFSLVGYTVTVFGIESTCKLTGENLEIKEDFPVIVDVVPSMPLLQVSTALPKVRSQPPDPDTPHSAPLVTAVTLYAGQR